MEHLDKSFGVGSYFFNYPFNLDIETKKYDYAENEFFFESSNSIIDKENFQNDDQTPFKKEEKKSRKRKLALIEEEPYDFKNIEDPIIRRRLRNRESAKRCRERKMSDFDYLKKNLEIANKKIDDLEKQVLELKKYVEENKSNLIYNLWKNGG